MRLPHGLGDARRLAIFLDFDGTLVDIVDRPDAVVLASQTREALARLTSATDGAVALVSGRDIDDIDGLVAPLRLPVAGVHGLTRRDARGHRTVAPAVGGLPPEAELALAPLLARSPRLLLERKTSALALHYRQAPELEADCVVAMLALAQTAPGLIVVRNKMVVELRPAGTDKGDAIAAFMTEPPFAGRLPVFAGDDVTDEDGFVVVNAFGGVSIKVGEGETSARWRASDGEEFRGWLADLAADATRQTIAGADADVIHREPQ